MKDKTYEITDSFFIYKNSNGRDKLIYVIDPLNHNYILILDLKQVERKVDERIQESSRFLDKYTTLEDLNLVNLFIFLLKVRLYEESIGNIMIIYMPLDEYERIVDSNYLAFIIAKYLLDKEHLYEENKVFIQDFDTFNKLYSLFKDQNFEISARYIKSLYREFLTFIKTEL